MLLAPVPPLASVLGRPAARLGGSAGEMARRNAMRNPGRTAATAAALMIGIALVTFVSVLANGIRVSNSDAIERQIQSDLIVTSQDGYSEFPAAVGDAVDGAARVALVSNVRQEIAQIAGDGGNLTGLDARVTTSTTCGGSRGRTRWRRSSAPTARSSRTTLPRTRISRSGMR